ncbi:hypothetical protein BAUCODRAFT_335715 [Baudoinia panamericana UAMH 10762]|uniref:Uncharacterized protein n=1 Tax=Baudoinia panamericana (strain UAMH 10762) TaxID=717646 RepID=M2MWA9_BAUPA|nr:uncharacterized protein BAUCODRAFT_335715 [Baudoinia panamericana UAMH 10762]EMC90869.1 hypothetical protein BAUCODRAFT_335715 [Baudoinia panamericana UAMH 10762]
MTARCRLAAREACMQSQGFAKQRHHEVPRCTLDGLRRCWPLRKKLKMSTHSACSLTPHGSISLPVDCCITPRSLAYRPTGSAPG